MLQTVEISELNNNPFPNRIFIIGGGILGASLSYFLSREDNGRQIVLIDKYLDKLSGSTGYAPGFVGQYNESPVLTSLAKDTVSEYIKVPGGFNVVGGLELSSTPNGVENLHRRKDAAQSSGLPAEIISPEVAASLAPDFIDPSSVKAGLHFPSDGTANAIQIVSYYIREARSKGVQFLEAEVTGFATEGHQMTTINSSNGDITLSGSIVILATGIWTTPLTTDIVQFPVPIIPVAHPYTFTPSRPPRSGTPYPFVRWLDHHVYARDHGDRDGLGSYDHPPMQANPTKSAMGTWPASFEQVLSEATSHLKNRHQFLVNGPSEDRDEKRPFNGIFAVTPDNLPLAGRVPGLSNLWLCAAIWILGGAEQRSSEDEALLKALDPARFQNIEDDILLKQALAKYNDIYNRDSN
ncbi:unnamed protein product [Penicillium pancosmium]